ncbi:MAG: AAA family ATPase, partial [Butyrivibrio sp.]|nr:AAA family ATPase [Butyrivibrio sp.]
KYLIFLRNLLKDQAYVALAYMTGILPIAKYSSGSELNMFMEYSMASGTKFGEYFGFLENEVNDLYQRFASIEQKPNFTKSELEEWYDGYRTIKGDKIYNPRSITAALTDNHIGSYWTSAGPYDEVSFYVKNNIDEIRDDIAKMISGEKVRCEAKEYAAVSMNLKTRDEILSAMVVYGFLAYEDGYVKIPNIELMKQFENMLYRESDLGYIYRLAKESQKMVDATINQNTEIMSDILEYAHDSESPILEYNNEIELSSIINLVYLSARDQYDIQREDKGGKGFVDFIFYPRVPQIPGIILELKVDETPQYALNQIKDKNYIMRFKGKIAENSTCKEVILVGISYDRKTKKHQCLTEKVAL